MWIRLLAGITLPVATACAPEPANYPPQEDIFSAAGPNEFIRLTAGGELVSADVGDGRVIGPEVKLILEATGAGLSIRGVAFNQPVSLTVTGSNVTGLVSAAPFNLAVDRDDAGLHAHGLVAGALADYRIDAPQISGTLGRCGYDLKRAGRLYEGARSCGGPPEIIRVLLPRQLSRWSDPALATVLGLLLLRS